MSSVKREAAALQALMSAFSDGVTGSKLVANLEVQSVNTYGVAFSDAGTYASTVLAPGLSRTLDTMMALLVVEESQNPGKPLLSVQNLRVVYTAIELTWQWGVLPTISKLSEFAPPVPPYPSSLLVQKRTIDFVQPAPNASADALERLVSTIVNIVCHDTFSGLMLQRNLDRILLTYLVLSNTDKVRTLLASESTQLSTVQLTARAAASLQRLYTGPFASMVVSKLRSFTKGPVWLRDASCEILSSILQGHRGVETVLSGYLEGSLDSSYAAALQAHVAKLVTTPPATGDKNAYLQNIAEQVRDLLLYGLFKNDKTLMRVCVLMVMRLAIVSPQLCHAELIQPLAAPLLAVFACGADDDANEADVPIRTAYVYEKYLYGAGGGNGDVGVIKVRDSAVLSDALSVQSCVELLHLLVTLCPMHAALARALCLLDVDTAMLHLYTHLLSARATVSPQLFETVESFLVNLYKFGGSKMVSRAEHYLYGRLTRPAWVLNVTKQGLVEVRAAPEPLASVSSLSQVLLAVKSDIPSVEEEKASTDVEVAVQMVKTRLGAVTSLLLIFEESITARSAQMDVTGPTVGSAAPPSSSGASSGKKSAPTSASGEVQSGGWECLGSELFLRSLSGFLRLPATAAQADVALSNNVVGTGATGGDVEKNEKDVKLSARDPTLCGLVVLELQENLPFVALLRDGSQILRLLKAFVEHYAQELAIAPAEQIEEAVAPQVAKPNEKISVLTDPVAVAAPSKRRPLIEEIAPPGTQTITAKKEVVVVPEKASAVSDPELITSVLGLLAAILSLGHDRRPDAEEALIRSLLEPLQAIAFRAPRPEEESTGSVSGEEDASVAQTAGDVALMILSRSYQQSHPGAASKSAWESPSSAETFAQMLTRMRSPLFLFSESPAMRGYATRIILQTTQRRSTAGEKLSSEDVSAALGALLPQLSDQESFVYLNALSAIRQLGELSPKVVFDALLKIFAGEEQGQVVSTAAIPTLPEARRAMVGEALVMLLHRAESLRTARPAFRMQVIELLPVLVHVCLAMARQRASAAGAASIESVVNLQTMRITASAQDDTTDHGNAKLLTNESNFVAEGGALIEVPQVSQAQLERAIAAADADILRQSAVSLLAEALVLAGAASHRYLDDVLDLALGILSVEQGHGESARAARRAAAYLSSRAITLLCESIGTEDILLGKKSRTYDSFQSTYETLQRCALHDTDEVVKFHASRGLFELQDLYAKLFTVREDSSAEAQVLEKFRIVK